MNTFSSESELEDFISTQEFQDTIHKRIFATFDGVLRQHDVPSLGFFVEDLHASCHVLMGTMHGEIISTPLTPALIDRFDLDVPEIFREALQNTPEIFPPRLHSLPDILKELETQSGIDLALHRDPDQNWPMYILTNKRGYMGSICVLYEGLLDHIRTGLEDTCPQFKETGLSLLMLPSSIHEFILIPVRADKEMSREEIDHFNKMITSINDEEVNPKERLSYHAYFYSEEEGFHSLM